MRQGIVAVYVAFFLVVAGGSYATIALAEQPTISIDNPDFALSANQTFTVDGRTYTVRSVSAGSAEATWVNESARFTDSWDNNSTVALANQSYRVLIPNESAPSSFTLREVQNVTEPTVTQNGTTYVVVERNDTRQLVPVDEYLPEPRTRTLSAGQTVEYNNNSTTVTNVTSSAVELEWSGTKNNTVTMSEGGTVDLNGQQYVAHFPSANVVQLSADVTGFQEQTAAVSEFHQRIDGLWYVLSLCGVGTVLMVGLAFLPTKS